ncbi:Sigma-70 family RNA polymerase sigma factor [Sulfidibacter corallicola]|uniref:Sigma-70 family RNA polymerase sigma factor n=1 Tax=Sulfidibacter corallicola TaxID=2818388 RepID=A0A8A4TJL4_SULCO|nr:ECF-type sigma factor [Sulfidibacter corallicola]QTD50116.1 sigma-70 family RNA polymerase sigma factor [Sulfidibacter corallicola]
MSELPEAVEQVIQASSDRDALTEHRDFWLRYYDELKTVARRLLRQSHAGQTFSTTVVVHETWLKLAAARHQSIKDEGHFMALSARIMRQILVSYARTKACRKRGGDVGRVPLDEERDGISSPEPRLLLLHEALDALIKVDPVMVSVVECRYFAGFTVPECAAALKLSTRTIERHLAKAKMFLSKRIPSQGADA